MPQTNYSASSNAPSARFSCPPACLVMRVHMQLLDIDPEDEPEDDGANVDLDSARKGKCAVIKTSTRQVRTQTRKRGPFALLFVRLPVGPLLLRS